MEGDAARGMTSRSLYAAALCKRNGAGAKAMVDAAQAGSLRPPKMTTPPDVSAVRWISRSPPPEAREVACVFKQLACLWVCIG